VSDTETREARYVRWSKALLGRGTSGSGWVPIVHMAMDEADRETAAARAELARLRGVVEAVRAIHVRDGGWCAACNDMAPCQTARALASVPSSGETGERGDGSATSAERKALAADYQRNEAAPMSGERRARLMAHQPSASPEPTGADGEGEFVPSLLDLQLSADLAIAASDFGIAFTDEQRDGIAVRLIDEGWTYSDEDNDEPFAARPVLSREALRARLDGHWPVTRPDRVVVCDCGWKSDDDNPLQDHHQWRDHLAAVLDTQETGA
jgi:hypothetical protein